MHTSHPHLGDTEASAEGTAAHEVALLCARLARPKVDQLMSNDIAVTQEMLDGADVWLDVLERITALDGLNPAHFEVLHEYKLPIKNIHPTDCFGTVDAMYYSRARHELHVFDYKFGYRYVDAWENWQLLAYASGGVDHYREKGHEIRRIHLHIVQPRSYGSDGTHREWVITPDDLDLYVVRMLEQVAYAEAGEGDCTTHEAHCGDCNARHACLALQIGAQSAADITMRDTPMGLSAQAAGVELTLMESAQKLLEARVDGLRMQLASQIQSGENAPGWGMEPSAGREYWTQDPAGIAALGDALGVNLRKPEAVLTPNQARKVLDGVLDPKMLQELVERKRGAPKLIKVDTTLARRVFSLGLK